MSNALANAMSPYLRQHATNPVDWVEWSPAAFAEARRRDVPVLVSIGYATCHWCHVMAHEAFEDPAVAEAMNRDYVCIKVDREELPEVDELYMDAVQTLTGHGGWPLNAFIDHDGRPFFAGTYFPKPRWMDVLHALSRMWRAERPRLATSAAELTAHLRKFSETRPAELPADLWAHVADEIEGVYDEVNPGIGSQPKFPPSQLLIWMGAAGLDGAGPALRARAASILEAMQDAGLHDRVGGGFHRYSTDAEWRVPHFEKMLYDNALLAVAYAETGVRTGRADFVRTARHIGAYLLRDLAVTDPGAGAAAGTQVGSGFAGFASAEDADDPDGEGSFYAWAPDEVRAALGGAPGGAVAAEGIIRAWDLVAGVRELGRSGHLEPVTTHIPQPRAADLLALAREAGLADVEALRASWEPWLALLRERRDGRPRPIRDDKVLTDWNGLALWALATLARLTGFDAAPVVALSEVLARRVVPGEGLERLPGRPGYITDYGHLALGLVEAYRLLGDPALITRAMALVDEAVARLGAEGGGFFTTPAGRTDLFRRSREHADHAYPAGQHALAWAAVRLGQLTGEARFGEVAAGVWRVQARILARAPMACPTLLSAIEAAERPLITVVVAGAADDPRTAALLAAGRQTARHAVVVVPVAGHEGLTWPLFEGRREVREPTAFVCEGTVCRLPTSVPAEVAEAVR